MAAGAGEPDAAAVKKRRKNMGLIFILTIVLIIALIGSLPRWPHSKNWGYFPVGGVGLIILIILILFLTGHFPWH